MPHSQTAPERQQQDGLEAGIGDPGVAPKARRRQFTAAYKLRILEKADRCIERGQIGELLRREGLQSSYLSRWRRQRETRQLQALSPKKRGRSQDLLAEELVQLQSENERLHARLEQAEMTIDLQKDTLDDPDCPWTRPRSTRAHSEYG